MKTKTFLFIDTVSDKTSLIRLLDSKGKAVYKASGDYRKLFSLLNSLFKTSKARDLAGLVVVNGPGDFTQARYGVAFANALAYSLNLPLKAFKVGERLDLKAGFSNQFVVPIYIREPNISKSKKH